MNEKINQILEGIDIRFQEPLKHYTFTKVGGNAEFLAFPRNQYELKRIVKFANHAHIPWMVLGNASNIIVRDGGIPGFVIMFDRLRDISVDGYVIEAEAGAKLIDTTHVALHHSLKGFEFASGIPGSVGGAVFMNAGAYGGEIVRTLPRNGTLKPCLRKSWLLATVILRFKIQGLSSSLPNLLCLQAITSKSNRRWSV